MRAPHAMLTLAGQKMGGATVQVAWIRKIGKCSTVPVRVYVACLAPVKSVSGLA